MAKLPCMKLLACAGCAAALLLASSFARADDPPPLPPPTPPVLPPPPPPATSAPAGAAALLTHDPTAVVDTVYLRSGGVVRGRVADIATGEHVAILTSTGELRTVPWSDVDRVVVANTDRPVLPAPRAPKAAPPPPLQPDPPAMVGPFAFVHIEASGTTYLYRAPHGTTDFETVCEAPCDMQLPINDDYKIGGNGTKTTARFKLNAQGGGSVTLKVDGANWFAIIGGGTLAVVGGMTSYVGLLMAAAGSDHSSSSDGAGTAGLACFVIGGGVAALGVWAFVRGNSTDIVQTGPKAEKDAFLRTPSWRAASATEHGSAATFPLIFERRF